MRSRAHHLAAAALVLVLAASCYAQQTWSADPATIGDWNTAANWNGNQVPNSSGYVTNGGTAWIGSTVPALEQLMVGSGSVLQLAGDVSVSDVFRVGREVGFPGTYELRGGRLLGPDFAQTDNHFIVGYKSFGTFLQSGGQVITGHQFVPVRIGTAWASGSYLLSGGDIIGNVSIQNGSFTQTGGNVQGKITVGWDCAQSDVETYTLSAGTITGDGVIGGRGTVSFIQNGGTFTSPSSFAVCDTSSFFQANVYQTGGTHTIFGPLTIGAAPYQARFHLGGTGNLLEASLTSAKNNPGGMDFSQDWGTHKAIFMSLGGRGREASSTYDLRNGDFTTSGEVIDNQGVFTQQGGLHKILGELRVAGDGGAGSYTLTDGTLDVGNLAVGVAGRAGSLSFGGSGDPVLQVRNRLTFGANAALTSTGRSLIHLDGAGLVNELPADSASAGALSKAIVFCDGGTTGWTSLEVAGKDVGNSAGGFSNNFVIESLFIGQSKPTNVRLVDLFDNAAGLPQALYVHHLSLSPGSTLDLNGCKLYTDESYHPGGTILNGSGGGAGDDHWGNRLSENIAPKGLSSAASWTTHWIGAGTFGDTSTDSAQTTTIATTAANWMEGHAPGTNDRAEILLTNPGLVRLGNQTLVGLTVTSPFGLGEVLLQPSETLTASQVFVNGAFRQAGGTVSSWMVVQGGSYTQQGGVITGSTLDVEGGKFEQFDGQNNCTTLTMAGTGQFLLHGGRMQFYQMNCGSNVVIDGGTLSGNNANESIGYVGNGSVIQSGGTNSCWGLTMGEGGQAYYELSGGQLTVSSDIRMAMSGSAAKSHLVVNGGGLSAKAIYVGSWGGDADFDLLSGRVYCRGIAVAQSAKMTLQSGFDLTTTYLKLYSGSGFEASAGASVKLSGDFWTDCTDASAVDGLANTDLLFVGAASVTSKLEVAGLDLGPDLSGWTLNFALDALNVGSSSVRLANDVDNQAGSSINDAIYVRDLIVGPGGKLDLNGLHLYCLSMTVDPTASFLGGTPTQVPEPATLVLLLAGLGILRRRGS